MLLCEGEGKRSPQWKLNGEHYSAHPKGAFCFENNISLWSLRARAEWKPAFIKTTSFTYIISINSVKKIFCSESFFLVFIVFLNILEVRNVEKGRKKKTETTKKHKRDEQYRHISEVLF